MRIQGTECKADMRGSLKIPDYPLQAMPVSETRGVHMNVDLLDRVRDVRSGEGELLKSTG